MKIFLVGFHKTGTSSIDAALQKMGFEVKQDVGTFRSDLSDDVARKLIDESYGDEVRRGFPWAIHYDYLLKKHPDALFILSTRDVDDWYEAVKHAWQDQDIPMHHYVYGVTGGPANNETAYKNRVLSHNARVKDYFAVHAPDQLLRLDVCHGDGYEKLCPFLGLDVPEEQFPITNVANRKR